MSTTTASPSRARSATRKFPATLNQGVVFGASCWLLAALVFFAGQAIAQLALKTPYSLMDNYISDLGVTTCGPLTVGTYHTTVCSPLHSVMNIAFIVAGLLTLLGVVGTRSVWPKRRLSVWGLALLALSGAGEILVGLAPENVNLGLHLLGTFPGILGANVGVFLFGFAVWRARRWVGIFSLALGAVGLFGFLIAPSVGMSVGVAERLGGYPVDAWKIVLGVFLLSVARAGIPRRRAVFPGEKG